MNVARVRNWIAEKKVYDLDEEMGLHDDEDREWLDEYYEYIENEKRERAEERAERRKR